MDKAIADAKDDTATAKRLEKERIAKKKADDERA